MAVNPEDFIITRKRKKYRFALFANSPLCFEADEWVGSDSHLGSATLEVGAGTGLFSVALAEKYPKRQCIAVDVKADRLQVGARLAERKGLANVRFVRARVDQLGQLLPTHSVEAIWVTFPDPFPKDRAAKHRLMHPAFLQLYAQLLEPSGALYLKHDNGAFFQWSLEQLIEDGWRIDELSFDLQGSSLADDYKILTTYERRWLEEGRVTQFVRATRPR